MTQVTKEHAAKALEEAATHLEIVGWCRGHYTQDKYDPVTNEVSQVACLVGAIRIAEKHVLHIDTTGWSTSSYDANRMADLRAIVLPAAATELGYEGLGASSAEDRLVEWNDKQRDKRKVIRLLRRTAKKLRNTQEVN